MSASITSNPNALNPIGNGLIWKIQLSDIGTDPLEKRAGWQLESSDGVVAEKSSTRPGSSGDILQLDFGVNIRGLVKTKLPTISALGVQNDTTIIKEFRLKYGDIVINKDTGTVTDNVSNYSSYYKVFNGANNIWDESLITSSGVYILSYRPSTYNILRGSLDYIWVLGSTTVTYTVYYSDNTTQSIVQSAPYDANIVPVGLPFLESLLDSPYTVDDVTTLTILVGSQLYTIGFEEDCQGNSKLTFMEVLFLEPAGGRSIMVFQDVDSAGTQSNSIEANIYKTISDIGSLRLTGDSVISKNTHGTFNLKRQTGIDFDEIRWMQGFGAATEYHLILKDRGGNKFFAKAILNGDPTFNLESKEMTCSLRLAKNIEAPYSF
jgi:signal peptidase I